MHIIVYILCMCIHDYVHALRIVLMHFSERRLTNVNILLPQRM